MPVAEAPLNPILEPPDFGRLMVFTVLAVAALWALFLVLTIVRYWSARAQKRETATGGLDLETLERQRDAGNISQEEYERIRGTMTGASPGAPGGANAEGIQAKAAESEETPPERPINPSGGPVATGDSTWRDGQPGRSESNGQG
jgi:hypothetical protein